MSRVALIVSGLAIAAVCAWAGSELWDTVVPPDVELDKDAALGTFPEKPREEAEEFESLMRWLFVGTQIALVATLAVYVRKAGRFLKESAAGPIGTGFLMGMMGISFVWLVSLPLGLVETWWMRRYEVIDPDEQAATFDYLDFLVGSFLALSGEALSLCVVLLVAMGFARLLRSAWWLPGVAVLTGITALLIWLSPYLLPDLEKAPRDIAADARPLAVKQDVEGVDLHVEDVEEETELPNAYATGLGDTRKIVLWNTLVNDFSRPEVRAVVSHEYGHHQHDHLAKSIGWSALFTLPAAFIVTLLTRRRRGGLADPSVVPLALLVVIVLQLAASPLTSGASRRYEAEADWAALEATRDPEAVRDLHHGFTKEALTDPDPPGWFHFWFDSHPSGAERVAMAREWQRREGRK